MKDKRDGNQSKIALFWRDLLLEFYSWSRWIYIYLLPSWLSFPFQYAVGKILYGLALAALLLVYIPVGALRLFIQESMVDLWTKLVGENSAMALPALLQSFPSQWMFFSIIILIVWGLIVVFWAWKQHIFFKSIRESGIRIVRGPGRRLQFFERLQKGGVSGLGLGPTARLLPVYVSRKEDTLLGERISSCRSDSSNVGILITGIATSGKTRTAMEIIADLKPPLVFVWPRALSTINVSNLLTWNGSAILFADNLTLSTGAGDTPLPVAMVQLLQQCPHLTLLGTIRRNLLTKDLRGLDAIELTEIDRGSYTLQQLAQYVASAESQTISNTNSTHIMQRYNGHPAGLVAGIDAMREIYKELDADQRAILRAAKLLRKMGVQSLSRERIQEAAQLISGKQYSQSNFHDLLEELSETGFVTWTKNIS